MKEYTVLLLMVWATVYVKAQTKMETLDSMGQFSEFIDAVKKLSQTANLENVNIQTLVVPVNSAFDYNELGESNNDKQLCLQTHMLTGDAFDNAKINGDLNAQRKTLKASTKRGGMVYFHKFGDGNTNWVDTAELVGPEKIITVGGYKTVIHGINKILCPFTSSKFFNQDTSVTSFIKDKGATIFNDMFNSFVANKPGAKLLSQITFGGTFFAPLDSAIQQPKVKEYLNEELVELKKKENADKMEKILESHVIDSRMYPKLSAGEIKTYHTGDPLTVSIETQGGKEIVSIKAGDTVAQVIGGPLLIGNGMVYYVDTILDFMFLNCYSVIMTNPHTLDFKSIIPRRNTHIIDILTNRNKTYTVFPVDNPGIKGNKKIEKLTQEEDKLIKALEMIIVPDHAYTFEDLLKMNGQKLTTLNGDVEVSASRDTVYITGGGVNATIVEKNLKGYNGMVHVVNQMLSVGSTTVRDLLARDSRLSYQLDLFDKFGFTDYLNTGYNLTIIGAYEDTFSDARKKKEELNNLLKDTKRTDEKYVTDMKNFLSLFILEGDPKLVSGMKKVDLEAYKYPGYNGPTRKVGIKGDDPVFPDVVLMYKGQTVKLDTPYSLPAANGMRLVAKDILVDLSNIKTGQVLGAATAKLHTGLALVLSLIVLKFWL